jgi:hypothetical protein
MFDSIQGSSQSLSPLSIVSSIGAIPYCTVIVATDGTILHQLSLVPKPGIIEQCIPNVGVESQSNRMA